MQIHRFRGRNLKDALERARDEFGEQAVVLSHETGTDGGVTVSVTSGVGKRSAARGARSVGTAGTPAVEPGLSDVATRLRAAGTSPELADDVIEFVREKGSRGAFAIDTAAAALAERFPVAPSPGTSGGPRVIVFVGPTGSGKTLSLCKLAQRLSRAGRRVRLSTLDTEGHGAMAHLRSVADELDIPLTPIRYREDLGTLLSGSQACDAILLDTRGRSPADHEHLGQLKQVLTEALAGAKVSTYLVVPACCGAENLQEIHRGFACLQPEALVVTKVDETRRTSIALEFSKHVDLPVVFLCNGQDMQRDFYRATPDRMADLVLGGRVR